MELTRDSVEFRAKAEVMTTGTETPYRSQAAAGRESFWHLVHAEWTKFRTVRGWVIAMVVAILAHRLRVHRH